MKYRNSSGDTIVEVMIAVVIAGLALGIAYQLSNASLRTSVQSSQRSQALSVSSAQIERMKAIYNQSISDPTHAGQFDAQFRNSPGNPPFCVDPYGLKILANNPTTVCNQFEGSIYNVIDTYDNTNNADTFVITITWANINGHGNDQQVLYYRFPK